MARRPARGAGRPDDNWIYHGLLARSSSSATRSRRRCAVRQARSGSAALLFLPLILIVVFYFLLIRPQQKKQKEHRLDGGGARRAGDEIVTGGGVLGKVTDVGEQFVTVEIADGVQHQGAEAHRSARCCRRARSRTPDGASDRMNRYPLWKNLLVFGVVVAGDDPRLAELSSATTRPIQVSRTDGVAIDDADARRKSRTALTDSEHRVPGGRRSRTTRAVVRFDDARDPSCARSEALREGVSEPRRRADARAAHAGVAAGRRARSRWRSASICAAACTSSTRSTSTPPSRQYLDDVRDRPAHAAARGEHPQRRARRPTTRLQVAIIEPATSTAPRRSSAGSTPAIS